MDTKKVWLVTESSKGLGLTLVKRLLAEGYKVAATSRNANDLSKEVTEQSTNFLPLQVDLVNEESVAKAIAEAIEKFCKIDVVVNNAGYEQLGTLEELTVSQIAYELGFEHSQSFSKLCKSKSGVSPLEFRASFN